MVEIPLRGGKGTALVDDADALLVRQYPWYLSNGYAKSKVNGKWIGMHRLLLPGEDRDHIDQNKLNNQRENLRPATNGQNQANRPKRIDSQNQYKGVARTQNKQKPWMAFVRHEGKRRYLGVFAKEEDAALAYDAAVFEVKGEFATLNFPELLFRGDFPTSTVNPKPPSTAPSILPLASVLLEDEEAA